MGNALMVIRPYKQGGIWGFDDPDKGLKFEPFVAGIPEIIEMLLLGNGYDESKFAGGFNCVFSEHPFPGHQLHLVRLDPEGGGYWYRDTKTRMEGWLCPATLHYFPDGHPPNIYVSAT